MVIEAFLFLAKKMSPSFDNTVTPNARTVQNRKRPLPVELNGRVGEPPSRSPRIDSVRIQSVNHQSAVEVDAKPLELEEKAKSDADESTVEFYVDGESRTEADAQGEYPLKAFNTLMATDLMQRFCYHIR